MGLRNLLFKSGRRSRRCSVGKRRNRSEIHTRWARFETLECRRLLTVSLTGAPTWAVQGPGPINNGNTVVLPSGQNNQQAAAVESIAVNPNNASQIIIGTANGGVWRTTNASASTPTAITWTPLTDQLGSLAIGAVAYDPSDTTGNTFYAGTGQFSEGFEGGPSVGLYKTTNAGATWTLLGFNSSGTNILAGNRIKSIVVIGSTILVGAVGNGGANYTAAGGGLFISSNGGATWTQDTGAGGSNLPAGPVTSVIQDPNNAQRVYAAVLGQGVFSNSSAGAPGNWAPVNTGLAPLGASTEDIELSAQNNAGSTTLFAGISGEGSITNATNASPIVITAASNGLVTGEQVYISGVNGNTAANATNNTYTTITRADANDFSLNGTTGNGAYTSGGSWESFNVFTSTNNGGSWTQLANFASAQQFSAGDTNFNEKFQVQADPATAGVVYIDGEGVDFSPRIYRYNPAGPSWVAINYSGASGGTSPHPDSRAMAFIGNTVLLDSNDGGIYEMQNPTNASANTWNSFNGNLDATEIYVIAYDQKQQTIAAGVQDNGSPQQNSQNNATWTDQTGGDGQYQAVDATSTDAGTGSLHYALSDELQFFNRITYNSGGSFVSSVQVGLRSSFGGANFSGLDTLDQNLAKSAGFNFTPFVINNVEAGGPGMMLLGSNGLYEDNGTGRVAGQLAGDVISELTTETGPATSPTISLSGTTLTGQFSALAYGGNFGGSAFTNVAVVGTNSGQLFFRGQTGAAFTNVTASLVGSGGITSIALDPQNWRHVYVIQGNKVETTADITNLGSNPFTVIGGGASDNLLAATGQPGAPALSSVAVADVGTTAVPLVGAFGGVYRLLPTVPSANPADTWTRYGQGLPNVIVNSVVYNAAEDVLVIGTFGRGAWTVASASTTLLASGVLNITGDQDYANENDTFRLVRDPNNNALLDVYINGTLNGPYQLGNLSQININGEGGNNTLIVDSSNGLIEVPNGIQYDGGNSGTGGFNTLQLDQPTSGTVQTSDTYSVGPNVGQGTDVLVGPGGEQTVYFTNLAPVFDSVPATTETVFATNAANAINYSEGYATAANLMSNTPSAVWGQVSVDTQEPLEFTNKDNLVINGAAGSDVINLNNPNKPAGSNTTTTPGLLSITVNGDEPPTFGATSAGDTLIANGTAAADTINFAPTSAYAGTITGAGPVPITFTTIKSVTLDGQGGGDALTVTTPAGTQDVTVTPGALADEGQVTLRDSTGARNALAGLSFTDIGAGGSLTIAEASGAALDNLTVNGTDASNLFNVLATGEVDLNTFTSPSGATIRTLVSLFTTGVSVLNLEGLGGNNVFDVAGSILFTGGIFVDGGDSSDGNTLNLTAPTGAVAVALGVNALSTDTTITGYGATVTLSGIDVANLALASNTLAVTANAPDDTTTYTPISPTSGSFHDTDQNTVFNFTAATGAAAGFTINGATDIANTVVLAGTNGRDKFIIDATLRTASITPVTTLWQPVTLGAAVQILTAEGGSGEDTFQVTPAVGTQFGATGNLDNLLINVDGGIGGDNALLVQASGGGTLAANQFVVVNRGQDLTSGTVRTFTAAVQWPDINYTNVQTVSPQVAGTNLNPNLLVMGPDIYESNDTQGTAAYLGSASTLQIQNASIFPNSSEFPGVPADQDYYRVVTQTTGTLDFQVYFKVYATTLLPAGGELDLQVLDAAGNVIASAPGTFGAQGAAANARVRIPAVAGQSYYLHVYGGTAAGVANPLVVNGYNATIINTPPPVPYDLELSRSVLTATVTSGGAGYTSAPTVTITGGGGTGAVGTAIIANGQVKSITISEGTGYTSAPTITLTGGGFSVAATATAAITDTGDEPAGAANDDSGRSQFDNVTNVNEPTIYIRLADGALLNDLPGNGTTDVPPAGVIPIPYDLAGTTPGGFRVAIFDGTNTQTQVNSPLGYATPVNAVTLPGLYQYTFTSPLADGVHNLVAEVQMIDPATPTETGFGSQSTALQITVDTVPPPVFFGSPTVAADGLASDSGVKGYPLTNTDDVTNNTTPNFWGTAEANSIVRVYAQDTTAVNIATATEVGNTVTITTAAPHGFSVGSVTTIAGVGVAGYNGTFTITSVLSPTTFTYTDSSTGLAASSGGTAASYVLLGTTVAVPDDGTNVFPGGQWNLTSTVDLNNPLFFPHDGTRDLLVTAEDLAGNVSAPDKLSIFIDTQGPQISNVQITGSPNYNLFGEKTVAGSITSPTPLVNSLTISVVDNPNRDAADFPNYLALLIPTPVVTMTSGGSGYTSPPTVTFSGGGAITQATGTAIVVDGVVTGVVITSSGNDYTSAPTVTFSGGGFTTPATATTILQSPGNFVLQGDSNGIITIESLVITDNPIVTGQPATATVQLIFAAPLPDDRYTLTIDSSSLVDPAGNELDGESNAAQPNGAPTFPSGNGIPGGNFVGRFTVNSRPEIGTWSGGNAWIDTNGNFIWDPNNTDASNRDASYALGYASDKYFAGNFIVATPTPTLNGPAVVATVNIVSATEVGNVVTITTLTPHGVSAGNMSIVAGVGVAGYNGDFVIASVLSPTTFTYIDPNLGLAPSSGGTISSASANGFSKLAAYGLVNGQYRWLITNDAGAPVISFTDAYQINGQPIAGDWNPTGTAPASHDEVGLYDGTNWDLFTGGWYGDGLNGALTQVPVWHAGYPIVGDFDGSGHVSLATYDVNAETFYFQLWDSVTKTWDIHQTIHVGGDGIQLGATTRPVAADMDGDGITDIGLYTPDTTGGTSSSPSNWYFWLSNDFATNTQGQALPQQRVTGQVNTLNHPFSPVSLGGHDLFAQMGNNYALPIVGLFDPPPAGAVSTTPTAPAAPATPATPTAPTAPTTGKFTAPVAGLPLGPKAPTPTTSTTSTTPGKVTASAVGLPPGSAPTLSSLNAKAADYVLSVFNVSSAAATVQNKKSETDLIAKTSLPTVQ